MNQGQKPEMKDNGDEILKEGRRNYNPAELQYRLLVGQETIKSVANTLFRFQARILANQEDRDVDDVLIEMNEYYEKTHKNKIDSLHGWLMDIGEPVEE